MTFDFANIVDLPCHVGDVSTSDYFDLIGILGVKVISINLIVLGNPYKGNCKSIILC